MEVGNDATIELEFGFSISLFVGGGFTGVSLVKLIPD